MSVVRSLALDSEVPLDAEVLAEVVRYFNENPVSGTYIRIYVTRQGQILRYDSPHESAVLLDRWTMWS